MESVPWNPVTVGKAISKADEKNLNLITVSSVWEQKAVVIEGADLFHVFMKGVSGGTKRGNMKTTTV